MYIFINRHGEIRPWVSIAAVVAVSFAFMMVLNFALGVLSAMPFMSAERLGTAAALLINSAVMLVSYTVQSLIVVWMFRLFYKRNWREMGFLGRGAGSGLALGLAFGAVSIAAAAFLLVAAGQASIADADPARMLAAPFWLGLFQFVLVGVYEELLSRGFMMTALKTTRNKYVIVLLPAVVFGLLHIFNSNVTFFSLANIALVGVLFAYLMIKTGNIWASIGYHITWNFVQGNVLGIAVSGGAREGVMNIVFSGPDWLTGGAFGIEGGAACTLVLLLGLLFIRFCVKTPAEPAWTLESGLPMPLQGK